MMRNMLDIVPDREYTSSEVIFYELHIRTTSRRSMENI